MLHRLLTGIVRLTAPNADLRTMAGTAEGALILWPFRGAAVDIDKWARELILSYHGSCWVSTKRFN